MEQLCEGHALGENRVERHGSRWMGFGELMGRALAGAEVTLEKVVLEIGPGLLQEPVQDLVWEDWSSHCRLSLQGC